MINISRMETLREILLSEFDSNNTALLDVEEVKQKLLTLQYIRDELEAMGKKCNE